MTLQHEGWEILPIENSADTSEKSVSVSLEFSLEVGRETVKGKRVVRIGLNEFYKPSPAPRKILRVARKRLEDYFDGHSVEDENLFSDCFDDDEPSGLTAEQERSLEKELKAIEQEFETKRA